MEKLQKFNFVEKWVRVESNTIFIPNFKFGNFEATKRLNLYNYYNYEKSCPFTIRCKIINKKELKLRTSSKALSFYLIKGDENKKEVYLERAFSKTKKAIIVLRDLFSNTPEILFNRHFDLWSKLRISKMLTCGAILTDIVNIKLLLNNILPIHAGCVGIDEEKGILIAALPDVGKTYSTLKLLQVNQNLYFMSEDIVMIDNEFFAYAVPYTETVDKRMVKDNLFDQLRKSIYEKMFKINFTKKNIFDAGYVTKDRFLPKARVKMITLLYRDSKEEVRKLSPEEAFNLLLPLNRLEFSYFRNEILLTYLFFNQDISIDEIMYKERRLLMNILREIPIYMVKAPKYDKFYPLILKLIEKKNIK